MTTQNYLYCNPATNNQVEFWFGVPNNLANAKQIMLKQPRIDQLLLVLHTIIQHQPIQHIILVNQAKSFSLIRCLVVIFNALTYSQACQLTEITQPLSDKQQLVGLPGRVGYITPHYSALPNITL
ncbi:MAG: hypothetical protein WCW27_02305 [Patescibacteria group bacterium]|jgi:hypothetical protein